MGVSEKDVSNEIRAVDQLCTTGHPNIVQVFGCGKLKNDGALYFIDMELCGFTLESYIQNGCHDPSIESREVAFRRATEEDLPTQFYNIANQIVEGLNFIHDMNQVHRDLSPNNGKVCFKLRT
jgi:serine/threonine protein kinase